MSDITFVSADILGGLGNHLFIIAMLIAYVERKEKKIVFKNTENCWNQFNFPRKTFWNTLFKDQFKLLEASDFDKIRFNTFMERDCHMYQEFPIIEGNVFLKGYFQSFRYINDSVRDKMVNLIYSNQDLMISAYTLYNQIKDYFGKSTEDNDMVSMHIRRTDYVLLKDFNNNLDENYYNKALSIVNRKNIVVFSDDIKWCKDNVDKWFDDKYHKIYFVDIDNAEIEFILMSMFQHNIIANSTYSLWASFISTYQQPKIVVAPKKWFVDSANKHHSEIFHKYITHII